MTDNQSAQLTLTEIHAARIRTASPRALREKDRKWAVVEPLLKGAPRFDPKATIASQAKKHGVSVSAAYKWLRKCERGTRTAIDLLEATRGGKDKSRAITNPELIEFAQTNALQFCRTTGKPEPAVSAVMRLITAYADECGWEVPTRYALRRLLWSIPRTHRVYAAKGKEGLAKDMPKPPVHRAARPNEAWVSDHKTMDLGVFCTDGRTTFRPVLTAIIDRFDGCLLGFCLSRQGNGMTFGRALRMAMLPKAEDLENILLGRPDKLVTDRGKDFLGDYPQSVLQKLGIDPRATIGRSPWSKGDMEGFFAVLDRMLTQFLKGHTGNRPTEKPVDRDPVYNTDDLERVIRQWFFQVYNHLPFMNRRLNGQEVSRLQLRRSVPFPIHTVDPLDIDILLLPRVTRTFGKRGLEIDSIPYWTDDCEEFRTLAAERATVEVGIDYEQRGRVLVFHKGRFVCYAFNWDAMKAGVTQDDVRQRLQDRRHHEKAVRDAVNPKLQAAAVMEDYIQKVGEQNARESARVAAVAGARPRIPLVLPSEASVRMPGRERSRPATVRPLRPARADEGYNDPYLTPIPGTEVSG